MKNLPGFQQLYKSQRSLVMPRFFLLIWLGILTAWAIMLSYLLWRLFAARPANEVVQSAGFAVVQVDPLTSTPWPTITPPPSPAATPTSLSVALEPVSLPPSAVSPPNTGDPPPTPPPGGALISLSPAPAGVGWTSSIDGHSHLGDNKIHAGYFKGHVYHGAIQFDLSAIPAGSTIRYAALELTGLSDRNLGIGGVWQLRLLAPDIDALWPSLTYDKLRTAAVASTLQPVLPSEYLRQGEINRFIFDDDQRQLLAQSLESGLISFRLDGPSSGLDNLFTWDAQLDSLTPEDLSAGDEPPAAQIEQIKLILVIDALNYVVVTSTPTPENVLTLAAQLNLDGTPTTLPPNWVTPIIVTSTPTPATSVTADHYAQLATAAAQVYGTATPMPINVWTATPTPLLELLPSGLPADLTPTPTRPPIPAELIGKIAFVSDRTGSANNASSRYVFAMDADGSNIFLLSDPTVYEAAIARDRFTADQTILAFSDKVQQETSQGAGIFIYDYLSQAAEQITRFEVGSATNPVWSPVQDRFAFVADNSGAEEIWAMNRDGSGLLQLTRDAANAVDRHPSYSPDSSQIVFWSNRTGRAQIWVMDAEGRDARILHESRYNDWNPVWIKYTDYVIRPLPGERTGPPELE